MKVATSGIAKTSNLNLLLEQIAPNFLQLDFELPENLPWGTKHEIEFGAFRTTELLKCMNPIHKWLFLRPDFVLFTNGTGSRIAHCMEAISEFLIEHGSDEMPIAAVRGTNLLATVDPWLPSEIVDSGRKALWAQVEIGGVPLAAALAEGARIVVAGAYDQAAPLLASTVASGEATWHDFDKLAKLATASVQESVVVNCSETRVEVTEPFAPPINTRYADVVSDTEKFKLKPTPRGTWQVSGVTGQAAEAQWTLKIALDDGYQSVALSAGNSSEIREFCGRSFPDGSFAIEEFSSVNKENNSLCRMFVRGETLQQCEEQMHVLESWLIETGRRYDDPPPSVRRLTKWISVPIPADQVTLSVETRPAREWL